MSDFDKLFNDDKSEEVVETKTHGHEDDDGDDNESTEGETPREGLLGCSKLCFALCKFHE